MIYSFIKVEYLTNRITIHRSTAIDL